MSVAKAASAGAWSALDIGLRQVVSFVVAVILARLLAPEDFGLIALLAFFTSLSTVFVQGGLSLALVQRQQTSHEQENAVFWVNFIAGIFFALVLIAIAPAVARFYGYPMMDPLMYAAAAQIVLSSLGAVHTSLLTRALRFDQLTKTGIVSSLSSGVAGVWAAYAGLGAWALAIQLLVLVGVGSAALWWVADWRPSWRVRFSSIRVLFGFGVNISLSSLLEVVYANGFVLIIGKLYGARDVAFLNRAAAIQGLPTGIISAVIARTALPLFAERFDDKEALLRGLRLSIRLAMLLSLPLMAGLSVLSDLVVLVLLGPKWLPAAPVLTLAAMGGALLPMHVLCLQLLLAGGKSRTYLHVEIQKKIAGVLCYGVGCLYGIMGMAYASLIFSVISLFINVEPTRKMLGYGVWRQLTDARDSIAATIVMAASVYGLRLSLDLPPHLLLAVLVLFGAAVYLVVGLLFKLESFVETYKICKYAVVKGKLSIG